MEDLYNFLTIALLMLGAGIAGEFARRGYMKYIHTYTLLVHLSGGQTIRTKVRKFKVQTTRSGQIQSYEFDYRNKKENTLVAVNIDNIIAIERA